MNTTYDQSGNYAVIAGIAVAILSKLGVSTDVSTIMTILAGILAIVGVVKQFIAHRNLAIKTGNFR